MKAHYKITLFVLLALFNKNLLAENNKVHPHVPNVESCSKCHDTEYIKLHSSHYLKVPEITCLDCHYQGNYKKNFDSKNITDPKNQNCTSCHGLGENESEGVSQTHIPLDFLEYKKYMMTKKSGTIFSKENISESFINTEEKENLNYPYDLHLSRGLNCISCHYAPNNPAREKNESSPLIHLKSDPRKAPLHNFLSRPDHRLKTASCTDCHDPKIVHDKFPYKLRHLEKLSCNACHTPLLHSPILNSIDYTAIDKDGNPYQEFRNVENSENEDQLFSTKYIKSYHPFLGIDKNKDTDKIAPFNIITTWYFVFINKNGLEEKIPHEVIRKTLEEIHLYGPLNTYEKVNEVKTALSLRGYEKITIKSKIERKFIHHGVVRGKIVRDNCLSCHGDDSDLKGIILLTKNPPYGKSGPENPFNDRNLQIHSVDSSDIFRNENGEWLLKQNLKSDSFYLFGLSFDPTVNYLGLIALILTFIGILIHAGKRITATKKGLIHRTSAKLKKVLMYSLYERIWHWVSALSIILLLITGFEIHFAGGFRFFGPYISVKFHNFLAVIMLINGFLSFFYHLVSKEIKQYLPPMKTFLSDSLNQIKYYTSGIFRGEPHPLEKTPSRKLNPLQQVTYLALLNILLPLQILTGILIWGIDKFPEYTDMFGGMKFIASVHTLLAYLFISFIFMHVYLTTTGHKIFSNIKAMITGYDEVTATEEKALLRKEDEDEF